MFRRFAAAGKAIVLTVLITTAASTQALNSQSFSQANSEIKAHSKRVQAVIDKSDLHYRRGRRT